MSCKPPYQWLHLRRIKPRPILPLVSTRAASPSPSLPTSRPARSPSKADIAAFLRAADDTALVAAQRRLSALQDTLSETRAALAATCQQRETIASAAPPPPARTTSPSGRPLPGIPAYTVQPWRRLSAAVPHRFARIEAAAERVAGNLADLRSIPYPHGGEDGGEGFSVGKDGGDGAEDIPAVMGSEDDVSALRILQYRQAGEEHRMQLALDKLNECVEGFNALRERRRVEKEEAERRKEKKFGLKGDGSTESGRVADNKPKSLMDKQRELDASVGGMR